MISCDAASRATAVSFRQLKLFESIGRLNSVRRASEECALSQPAVTQALAKMEEQIGSVLVDRRASGSYLNDLGAIFYRRVTRFFDQVEAALSDLGVVGGNVKTVAKRLSRSQVRALVAVVEAGSFVKAAAALEVSEASLQRAMRDLQSNLRKPLFYRAAAGTLITPAGQSFGRQMKLASQEVELGVQELQAVVGAAGVKITIGALPFGGSVLLASVLDDFLQAHPRADAHIVTENAAEMQRRLRAGEVDIVIGLMPSEPSEDLVCRPLAKTPYSIVGRRGHPLARRGRVTLQDLRQHDWVIGNPGASRRACFERLFAGGPAPQAPITTCALPIIRQLLARSDRLTLMTSYELMHEEDGLSAIDFASLEPAPTIGVTTRAGWQATALHEVFLEIVSRHLAEGITLPVQLRTG